VFKYLDTLRILYTKELRNRLSQRKNSSYPKFLIVGLARSGTTLLHTYLNSHPNIISGGERKIELIKQEIFELPEHEREVFPPFPNYIKAAGAKVLLPHQQDNSFFPALNEVLAAEPSFKVLFLKRENLLSWYVSLCIALNTKQWSQINRQKKTPLAQRQIKIPIDNLLPTLKEASKANHAYCQLFNQFNTIEISYESLSKNPIPTLAEIQEFLDVSPAPLSSLLHKQNPEPLSNLILNYKEVEQALWNTPFQKFLES
jgi:LPS sulfotransferase NodH